ncbi:MAG: ribosomal RNA small subunit methyltransferase A [Bdellovibrionales bacterium]|nr:ribosomal RNA small subunit methyltransferase A [Bdellovibrionales bacterium]
MSSAPQADKRFGQHYLVNQGVIDRIADTIASQSKSGGGQRAVLELGPGPGALTRALLARGLRVVAVELDPRMEPVLRETFAAEVAAQRFEVLRTDAMTVDLAEVARVLGTERVVVCGNLPYNVGSQLVFRFLEEFSPADRFCYMLQKEVVLKFISASQTDRERRDYGPPGVKLNWCTRVNGHFWVSPGSFSPPPKVDSGVFWCERLPLAEAPANALERGGLYDRAAAVVARAFQQRRKMLRAIFPELASTEWATKRVEELTPLDLLRLAELVR